MNLLDANDRPGAYPPSWYADTAEHLPPLAPLEGARRADVCIVGGGYTGLSAALHLARAGVDVVLLEAQRVGFGASGRNGGQVGSGQRLDQSALESMMGDADARRLWEIAEAAKATIHELVATHRIDAAWRPGIVHAIRSRRDVDTEHAYAEKLATEYGYDRVEPLDRQQLAALIGSDAYAGGSLDRGAGHVHPLGLALGLARAALESGARLHELSRAVRLDGTTVHTDAGEVAAEQVILACNGYLGTLESRTAAHVMPINNFIVATEPLGSATPLAEDVAVADDRFVVNYWRQSADGRLLFGGGESHGYRFPRDIAGVVRPRLAAIYPELADMPITHAWGGTLAITRARMPWIARPRPGLLTAAGYSGHGVAMAVMAGRILAEAARGPSEHFDVMSRVPVKPFPGGVGLRAPLLSLAMHWYGLRDRLGL